MILGGPAHKGQGGRATLDEVLRRAAERRPGAVALIDPPDRMQTEGVAPRCLTYAEADRMVSAIAGRLRRIGLSTDAVVGMQFPNNVESVLTFLGILRAGMIASPLPLLWRRADCIAALSRIGAKGLITCGTHRGVDHCQIAMQVAAEIFPIRYVCGFGARLADGVIPLNDLYSIEKLDPIPPLSRERQADPASHVAVITWDVTGDGLIAVARSHLELLSAGVATVVESRIAQDATILSTVMPSSLAGLAVSTMPWLFSGGTLVLHDAFTPEMLTRQISEHRCDTLALPGAVAARLAETNALNGVKNVLAMWRSPERLANTPPWRNHAIALNDIIVFGETALIAGRRGVDGRPLPIPLGSVTAPRGGPNAVQVAEVTRTDAGTVSIRGPMVPQLPFPLEAERAGVPAMRIAPDGMVNTGFTCRIERGGERDALVVTGPPAGLVSVGGYRFGMRDLQELIAGADRSGTLAALPDTLTGQRLAGHSADRPAIRHALAATGANPLVVRAFRDRPQPDAA